MVVNLNSKSRKSNFWSIKYQICTSGYFLSRSPNYNLVVTSNCTFFREKQFHDFFESTAVVAYYYTNYNEMKIRLTHAIEYFLLTAEHFSVLLNCIEVYVQMNIITTFFDTMMAKRAQRETSSPWILCEIKNSILRGEFAVLEIFLYVFFCNVFLQIGFLILFF